MKLDIRKCIKLNYQNGLNAKRKQFICVEILSMIFLKFIQRVIFVLVRNLIFLCYMNSFNFSLFSALRWLCVCVLAGRWWAEFNHTLRDLATFLRVYKLKQSTPELSLPSFSPSGLSTW